MTISELAIIIKSGSLAIMAKLKGVISVKQVKPDLSKLKKLRKQNKETLMDLSKLLGYESPNGYLYIENGRCKITLEQAKILADHYNVPVESLFFEKEFAEAAKLTGTDA